MTVRWLAGDPRGVPSGYDNPDVPDDVKVPSCGIEDVDFGIFSLFNKEIGFQVVDVKDGRKVPRTVPVFMGVGEKWASVKKNIGKRDKQGTLILPLISIRRTGVEQKPEDDQRGRGINQATGELTFRRRLGPKDRAYQNLANHLGLQNQQNLPVSSAAAQVGTLDPVGTEKFDAAARDGAWLSAGNGLDNVWEFITIPAPQFYSATYEVTFWTQYTTHMNSLIQRLMAAKLPQLPAYKIGTKPGYWFVAYVDGEYKSEDNADDMTDKERVLKYTFSLRVPAYTVAPDESGMQSPVRRYVSAPQISFEIAGGDDIPVSPGSLDQVTVPLLDSSDDPTLDRSLDGSAAPRATRNPAKYVTKIVKNPFTGKESATYVRVVSSDRRSGERVFVPVGPGLEFDIE